MRRRRCSDRSSKWWSTTEPRRAYSLLSLCATVVLMISRQRDHATPMTHLARRRIIFCPIQYRQVTVLLLTTTPWTIKKWYFIFHYNSRIFWWIFTLCVLRNVYKIYDFTLAVFNCGSGICSSGWLWPTASCSAFDRTGCAHISRTKHIPIFHFIALLLTK